MKFPRSIVIGLIAGLIFSGAWFAMAKSMGFYNVDVYVYRNYLTFGLIILGVVLCVFLEKRSQGGFLEFKQALKTGMIYSLVLAVCIAIFNYVYYNFISPDTVDYFLSEAKNAMIADKVKPEDFPKYLDAAKANYGSFRLIPPVLFWGLVISLLSGAIFQKKDPNAFSAN